MSGLVVNLRAVQNALHQLERSGQLQTRQACIEQVLEENRAGRSGFAVASDLMQRRMARDVAKAKPQ